MSPPHLKTFEVVSNVKSLSTVKPFEIPPFEVINPFGVPAGVKCIVGSPKTPSPLDADMPVPAVIVLAATPELVFTIKPFVERL